MRASRLTPPAQPARLHLDVDGWFLRGGHRKTVHVTPTELQAVLDEGLPPSMGPWHLTGSDLLPTGVKGRYEEHPWAGTGTSLLQHGRTEAGQDRTNVWLWSERLSESHPPLSVGSDYDRLCSFNGFLLVQFPTTPPLFGESGRPTTRDICVSHTVSTSGGEQVEHGDYLRVWRRIARLLQRVATIPGPEDGHPLHDGWPWSPAAFEEASEALGRIPPT